MGVSVDKILSNLGNFADLGRQRAFELGNPYYFQLDEDGDYWRKEMPDGRLFLVLFEVKYDKEGHSLEIIDTFGKLLN